MTQLSKIATRMLLVPIFIVSLAMMVKGYSDPGDGFSAGVIAALGVGLQVMVFGPSELERLPLVRFAPFGTFVGVILALCTAFIPAITGESLFTHWPPAGDKAPHFGTLEFITAVAFDVGVFLIVLGFGVGVIGAIARAEARLVAAESRFRRARAAGQSTGDVS
jgi:multisubunit Na+/H+ antiporter MnhB subunit